VDAEELREKAQAAVLTGLPAGRSLAQIEADVAQCHERRVYMPDVAMLELVVAALDVAGVSRDRPVSTADWRERYLPELTFRNRPREVERLVYALQTGAAFRTGLRPDVLEDTYSWGTVQVLPYATRAAVMTIRAVAADGDLAAVCDQIAGAIQPLAS
jgi:hypothetical protein